MSFSKTTKYLKFYITNMYPRGKVIFTIICNNKIILLSNNMLK